MKYDIKDEAAVKKLKIIENYNDAVLAVRKKYYDAAVDLPINSEAQLIYIDQLLVLDFMIESNQRVLNYLNHFKKHQTSISIQALEEILNALIIEERENIHITISRFKNDIVTYGKNVSEQLKKDYNFKGNIYALLTWTLFILLFAYGPITATFVDAMEIAALTMFGVSLSIIEIPLIISLVLLAFFFRYQTNLYSQPGGAHCYERGHPGDHECGRIADCLEVQTLTVEPDDSTLFEKSYAADFAVYTTHETENFIMKSVSTLFQPKRQAPIGALREKFARDFAVEVEGAFNTLNQR